MKLTSGVVLLLVGAGIGWALSTWRSGLWAHTPVAVSASYHTGPTVEQLQTLSTLVTTRVDVADVQETRIEGQTGGIKAALLVKGDFLVGTDLSHARFEGVNTTARTAVLVLAQPQVTSPRLDHERTRVFAVTETGLWQIAPGEGQASAAIVQRAYRDAQRLVASASADPSVLHRARQQAELVLGSFFAATRWKVTVRWAS